ncbi:hypothetical protein WJX73_003654 [Symbiochloris irregularis]|uniref:Uncharacterized protein n=1 Tax=Symbiochloris irregularis TaxID=706552 RepID=A0AAW1NSS4_9CHLO
MEPHRSRGAKDAPGMIGCSAGRPPLGDSQGGLRGSLTTGGADHGDDAVERGLYLLPVMAHYRAQNLPVAMLVPPRGGAGGPLRAVH